MKPQDIFGIILRTIGVWLCIWGAWNALAGFMYFFTAIFNVITGTPSHHDWFGYVIYGIPAIIAGWMMLSYTDAFVRFTYPREMPPPLPPDLDKQD
jgi:surface polysaccharide O-acyltransferase-like enzyme